MPLTITLRRNGDDRAEALHGDMLLSAFEPRALLVDQPLAPDHPLPADPRAYGRRLWAAGSVMSVGRQPAQGLAARRSRRPGSRPRLL